MIVDSHPVLGDWKLKATSHGVTTEESVTITEYVLPKFEVSVELPSFILIDDAQVHGTVEATYTYGKPVTGKVEIEGELKYVSQTWNFAGSMTMFRLHNLTLNTDGKATFAVPLQTIRSRIKHTSNSTLVVTANVTESLTHLTLSGSEEIMFSEYADKIEFLPSTREAFKPGLPYKVKARIMQIDNTPIKSSNRTIRLQITSFYEEPVPSPIPPYYYGPKELHFSLVDRSIPIPTSGIISEEVDIPTNVTKIELKLSSRNTYGQYKTVQTYHSPSNSYIQLELLSGILNVGTNAVFRIQSTKPIPVLFIQVLARGALVFSRILNGYSVIHKIQYNILTTRAMGPSAEVVVFYVTSVGEIVVDHTIIAINDFFESKVSVKFDKAVAKPGEKVTITVKTDPLSYVNILLVDKSVSLVHKENDITETKVIKDLHLDKHMNTDEVDVDGLIANSPYDLLTDGIIYKHLLPSYSFFTTEPVPHKVYHTVYFRERYTTTTWWSRSNHYRIESRLVIRYETNTFQAFKTTQALHQTTPRISTTPNIRDTKGRIRKRFIETWMWSTNYTGPDGHLTFTTTMPDAITTWVASAFAVNKVTEIGFSLSTSSANIMGFQSFFISMNLPYSVVRGEEVSLQVNVFNYLPKKIMVLLVLQNNNDFRNIIQQNDGSIVLDSSEIQTESAFVSPGDVKSVFFPIVPQNIGPIFVEVTARSLDGTEADGIRRQLIVVPEGIPHDYNVPMYLGVNKGHPVYKNVDLSFPPSVVKGSQRIRVSTIGDFMGPTLNNLNQLVRIPSGCGEQNMINFAPDVLTATYLNATNQMSKQLQNTLVEYIEKGYQNQLNYQRNDGSFSAFGKSDRVGSMWLSAYVIKIFHKAKRHVFIDDMVLIKTIQWILDRQLPDGSFPEPGKVLYLKGASVNAETLTAFVLIALKENADVKGGLQISDGINRAQHFLERNVGSVQDLYGLSLISYALFLCGSSTFGGTFTGFNQHAIVQDDLRYWRRNAESQSNGNKWSPPNKQADRIDIETTAYALLTYTKTKSFGDGSSVVRWLMTQRNPNGGFTSTQDTVIALESISEFTAVVHSQQPNMAVSIVSGSFRKDFTVNSLNALVLQAVELPQPFPQQVQIQVTGSGMALVEVAVFYNVNKDLGDPSFDVSVSIQEETIDLIETKTCTRWNRGGTSGMAVQEIGIPTGFEPNTNEIGSVRNLKRIEKDKRKVVLYFDEIDSNPVCIKMKAMRTELVSKIKPSSVKVYDYYEPEHQATIFYHSNILQNSTICDVCKLCRPCRRH